MMLTHACARPYHFLCSAHLAHSKQIKLTTNIYIKINNDKTNSLTSAILELPEAGS